MNCSRCGGEMSDENRFCQRCGAPAEGQAPSGTAGPPPPGPDVLQARESPFSESAPPPAPGKPPQLGEFIEAPRRRISMPLIVGIVVLAILVVGAAVSYHHHNVEREAGRSAQDMHLEPAQRGGGNTGVRCRIARPGLPFLPSGPCQRRPAQECPHLPLRPQTVYLGKSATRYRSIHLLPQQLNPRTMISSLTWEF